MSKKIIGNRRRNILLLFFICGLFFSLIASYSNRLSPYPFLSNLWLLQYDFMFCVAVGITYAATYKKFTSVLVSTLLAVMVVQICLSLGQFVVQGKVGLSYEGIPRAVFQTGLDENNAVLRVAGTFMFDNQLAFCLALILAFVLPISLKTRSNTLLSLVVAAYVVIVLSQCRSALVGVVLYSLLNGIHYRHSIRSIIEKIGMKRIIVYFVVALSLSVFALIPRILLTANTFFVGGGLSIRVRLMTEGVQALQASPFFGYGVGTNEYVLHKLFPNGVMTVFPAAVHLAFLQLALEVGILGVAFFLFPFFFLLRAAIKSYRKSGLDEYKLGLIGGCAVLTSYWLLLPHLGIIEFGFLGIVLGLGGMWYSSTDQINRKQ